MSANRRGLSNHKPSDTTRLFDSSMIGFYAKREWSEVPGSPVESIGIIRQVLAGI